MLRPRHVFAVILAASAAASAGPDGRTRAVQLAEQSERAYKAGRFEDAAELLRKAHAAYPEPTLLYNLGRALEGMGDARGAIDAYEQYLHDAKQIDDRPAIERRIATLKAQLEAAQQPQVDAGVTPTPDPIPDARPLPDLSGSGAGPGSATEPESRSIGPWVAMGAGGALLATGGLFGWRANKNHDDSVLEPIQLNAQQLQDAAHTDATIANVLFIAGGAAVVGGAIWELVEWRRGERRPSATSARLKVAPNGVAVEWLWR